MQYVYKPEIDRHYLCFREGDTSVRTISVDANVDLNNDGEIIGFEIFGIKHRVGPCSHAH